MKIALVLSLLLLFGHQVSGLGIDRSLVSMKGTAAAFTQTFTPRGSSKPIVESGNVVFGTLPTMRWTYTKPEEKVFVFDGTKSWFYVAADRQVTTSQIDDQTRLQQPFLLLSDPSARDRFFTIVEEKERDELATTLTARDPGAAIRKIVIRSDRSSRIEKVEYEDAQGNRTLFDLSGYHPAAISPKTFTFEPPAGVQTVKMN